MKKVKISKILKNSVRKKVVIGTILSAILLPISAFADMSDQCKIIHWKPDQVNTIEGSVNFATHVFMPVSSSVDPVVGNSDRENPNGLWHVEYIRGQNNVFLKPNDKSFPDGQMTNLTYIGDDGNQYEFILKRVDKPDYVCVTVENNGQLMDGSWSHYQTPQQKLLKLLAYQIQEQKSQTRSAEAQIINQQRKAMNAYRDHIFTNYSWKSHGNWWGRNDINSVYDDGRWTYIRLNNDEKGLMSVYGIVSGKQELLQYHYDAQNKIYRISGIYPGLVLAYDKNTINVVRKG